MQEPLIPPMGDPEFSISTPTNGQVMGPTFSVTGWGPKNMANLGATVGTTLMPAAQEQDSFGWEAIFVGMQAGTHVVSASYDNGVYPTTPGAIVITVDGGPGITIGPPAELRPMMATAGSTAGNGNNPWINWEIKGTYDPAKIDEVQLFVTRRGRAVLTGNLQKATKLARIDALAKAWDSRLDFVPDSYRGNNFLVHYRAKLLHGGTYIWGTCLQTFAGPQ